MGTAAKDPGGLGVMGKVVTTQPADFAIDNAYWEWEPGRFPRIALWPRVVRP